MLTETTDRDESLAAVKDGESIEVVYILFDSLRAFGEARGVRSGSRLRCRASGSSTIVLESETGTTVLFPRDLARFVRVRRTAVEARAAEPVRSEWRIAPPDSRRALIDGSPPRKLSPGWR